MSGVVIDGSNERFDVCFHDTQTERKEKTKKIIEERKNLFWRKSSVVSGHNFWHGELPVFAKVGQVSLFSQKGLNNDVKQKYQLNLLREAKKVDWL